MTRRLRNTTLAAAAAAVACLGPGGAPAHAAKHMEIAIQDDPSLVSEITLKRSKSLKLAQKLFVTRIRVNLPWSSIVNKAGSRKRPKHRRYNFASYDALLNAARARGMKLQPTISGFAPAWATGNRRIGGDRINVTYFTEFVKAVAKHFKGHVDRYGIWNEPNYVSWNGPLSTGASTYRAMYIAAYRTIRKIDPAAKILIGETAPYSQSRRCTAPLKFLRDIVRPGPLKADGYAHHPYDFRHSVTYRYPGRDNATIATLGNLTSTLDSLAASHRLTTRSGRPLDVYLTEYGYMGSGKYRVREKTRAKYLTHAFQVALNNPRVKQMLQYLLVTPPRRSAFFDTSIVTRKGKPRDSFKALQTWARREANAGKVAVAHPPGYVNPRR
jgi:GH35 family endo-1,4-beta-xylanase